MKDEKSDIKTLAERIANARSKNDIRRSGLAETLTSAWTWPPKRVCGVPYNRDEQDRLSALYLNRKIELLRKRDVPENELDGLAKQEITKDLDDFIHQIAGRSQTLLAVTALMISMFLVIDGTNTFIKFICVGWAIASLTLFRNVKIYFGPMESYQNNAAEYKDTVRLAYLRSLVLNANISLAIVCTLICVIAVLSVQTATPTCSILGAD